MCQNLLYTDLFPQDLSEGEGNVVEELETGPYDEVSGDENDIDEETMSGDNDVENSIHWEDEEEAGAVGGGASVGATGRGPRYEL